MEKISIDGRIVPTINGGHGSGNFGHSGRPGKVGGSGKGQTAKTAVEKTKKRMDDAKAVQEDIEDRIGQKIKQGEEYTALDAASKSRFKVFHGEDGTEYTYDKELDVLTQFDPNSNEEIVVERKKDSENYTPSGTKRTEKAKELAKKVKDVKEKTLGWEEGKVEDHSFLAKAYDKPSERYGIDGGTISKLSVKDKAGKEKFAYDRGWDKKPQTDKEKALLAAIIAYYDGK